MVTNKKKSYPSASVPSSSFSQKSQALVASAMSAIFLVQLEHTFLPFKKALGMETRSLPQTGAFKSAQV
jgi:hypothetical protein